MPDLVAEMAEQRAVRFVHGGAPLLALGVVGFLERERDQAVIVTGHHPRAVDLRRACQEIEHQALAAIVALSVERQIELHQCIEQPMLGDFDLPPGDDISCNAGVGDGAVVPAGRAVGFGRVGLDHPVANVELRHWRRSDRASCPLPAPARRRLRAPAPTSS